MLVIAHCKGLCRQEAISQEETMRLKRSRFDHLSREEAIELLNRLQGPLRELVLSAHSADMASGDVMIETLMVLRRDPHLEVILLTKEEWEAWDRFQAERGDGPEEIGEFVYGPDENPWARGAGNLFPTRDGLEDIDRFIRQAVSRGQLP